MSTRHMTFLFALLAAVACSSPDVGEDIACGPNGTCPDGYVCEAKSNRCIKSVTDRADAGRDATADAGGSADAARPADAGRDAGALDGDVAPPPDAPVDVTRPVVTITAPASGAIVGPGATLTYTVSEPAAAIECSFNGGTPFACGSGTHGSTLIPSLPEGAITASVRATDGAGNQGSASVTFNLRTTALTVTILPPASACPGTAIAFNANRAGASFSCKLDGDAAAGCESPFTAPAALAGGQHTLRVTATEGGDTASAVLDFELDLSPPTVVVTGVTPELDAAKKANPSGEIHFETSEPGSSHCTLDGVGGDCPPGSDLKGSFPYIDLSDAQNPHVFKVTVTDVCGNTGSKTFELNVDSTPPKPCLVSVATTGGPTSSSGGACLAAGQTSGKAGSLTFSGEPGSYHCTLTTQLPAGATASTSPPLGSKVDCSPGQAIAFAGLTDLGTEGRPYTLTVEGTDFHGNTSTTPLVWLVDTTGPVITLGTATAHQDSGELAVAYTVKDSTPGVTFPACSVDGLACKCGASGALCEKVSAGAHTLAVAARDAFGNTGATASALQTMSYGPRGGRAIMLGFDLSDDSADAEALLASAASDVPWKVSGAFDRRLRVLFFEGGKPTSGELANVDSALAELIDGEGTSSISEPTALGTALRGKDVLVVVDMNDPAAAQATGVAWDKDPALRQFLDAGGVVVVLDGSMGSAGGVPVASKNWQVLSAGQTPILAVTDSSLTSQAWSYVPTLNEVMLGAPSEILTVKDPAIDGVTATFKLADSAPRATYAISGNATVLERIFPGYDVSINVTGTSLVPGSTLSPGEIAGVECSISVSECSNVNGCCTNAGNTCPCASLSPGTFVLPARSGSYTIEARFMSPRAPMSDPSKDESPRPGRTVVKTLTVPKPAVDFYHARSESTYLLFCYHGTGVDGLPMTNAQLVPMVNRTGAWENLPPFNDTTGCIDPRDVGSVGVCSLGGFGIVQFGLKATDAAGNQTFVPKSFFAPPCSIIF